MAVADNRRVLSHFLRTRRARLRPQDVGLPVSRRRRLEGLRREEVAALAGVGHTWYGLLESGRNIHVSRRLIDSVAGALRLADEERVYLHRLLADRVEEPVVYERDPVAEAVIETLARIVEVPAFVTGPRLDYLAINAVAKAIYDVPADHSAVHRNLALSVFLLPAARSLYPDWELTAARTVAKFRRSYGEHAGNESFERLVARLLSESTEFRALWERHDIAVAHEPVSEALHHALAGTFRYRLQAFAVPAAREQSLVVMHPLAAADVETLRRLDVPDKGTALVLGV